MKNRENLKLWILLSIVLCALAFGIFGTVSSMAQTNGTIPNAGSVKGIGSRACLRIEIYWNPACTSRTSVISWGLLDPGSDKTATVYVKNEGKAVATLSMTAENWSPSTASNYVMLKWDYPRQTLKMNQVLQVKLTLVVSPSVSGIADFTFDKMVMATG